MADNDGMFEDELLNTEGEAGALKHRNVMSEAEVAQFTVDESLSELDKHLLFLQQGHPLQQKRALRVLPSLVRDHGRPAFDKLSSALSACVNETDAEGHIALAEAFSTVVGDKLLGPGDMQECLLPIAMQVINTKRETEIVEAWLAALFAMVPWLSQASLRGDVANLALSKGQVEETVDSRVVCCRLMGALAPHLERSALESKLFRKAMAMCQDTDAEVRICMCEQLHTFASAVSPELLPAVLPELFELLNDEDASVKSAALEALIGMLDLIPKEARKERVLPILHALSADTSETASNILVGVFGRILQRVTCDLEGDDDYAPFYEAYRRLAGPEQSPTLRARAAEQFPAVLKAVGARRYALHLHNTYASLCADPGASVRTVAARAFAEISTLLGKERVHTYLLPVFLQLLGDDCVDVQLEMLRLLDTTLPMFNVSNEETRKKAYAEIFPAFLAAEAKVGLNWRLQAQLLSSAFTQWPALHASAALFESLVPLCFRHLSNGPAPVVCAAGKAAAALAWGLRRASHRNEVGQRLVREFARHRSCRHRCAFVEVAYSLVKLCSTRLFRESFLPCCLELLKDPVPIVRIRSIDLLPYLKLVLRLPEDASLMERLNKLADGAVEDPDPDVAAMARDVVSVFRQLPTRTGNASRGTTGPMHIEANGTSHSFDIAAFEVADKVKEEGEAKMLRDEEAEDRRRLDLSGSLSSFASSSRRGVISSNGASRPSPASLRNSTGRLSTPLTPGGTSGQRPAQPLRTASASTVPRMPPTYTRTAGSSIGTQRSTTPAAAASSSTSMLAGGKPGSANGGVKPPGAGRGANWPSARMPPR